MFFPQRSTQAEYFDSPDRTQAEVVEGYASLNFINRLFIFEEPFQRLLPRMLGREACSRLTILDLGAGDGSLGRKLTGWAAKRGWNWEFTNLDINAEALKLNPGGRNVVGSALALPFPDASFDVAIASQMTHHFSDDEVVVHLREAWRVAQRGIFLSDLHRNAGLYLVLRVLFLFTRFPKHFQQDGLISVKRGFRVRELEALARRAGVPGARVSIYFGSRLLLQAIK